MSVLRAGRARPAMTMSMNATAIRALMGACVWIHQAALYVVARQVNDLNTFSRHDRLDNGLLEKVGYVLTQAKPFLYAKYS